MRKNCRCGQIYRSQVGRKVLGILTIFFLLIVSGCSNQSPGTSDAPNEVIELRLAHFWPASHPIETELVKPWAEAISVATNGKVKITSYPNQTLLPAETIYDGVVDGIADIGISCFAYTRGKFPILEVFELPGITYNSSQVSSNVAWEGIKQLNPPEVQDTKLMMVITTGSGNLFTKNPVNSLKALQGLEIRATGLSAKTLEALGAVPIAMPQSEAYESLAKGVVKANLGPDEILQGWKQAEVTDYITKTPFLYNTLFFVTMNMDKWASLGTDMQKAIEEVNEEYFTNVAAGLWDKQNQAALKWAVEECGMKVIHLAPQEAERWVELVEPIQEQFVKQMNKKGFEGDKILAITKQLAEKYNQAIK